MMAIREKFKFNVDSQVEMYMENRHGARRMATSFVWTKTAHVLAQVSHHAGLVNWGFMVFVLSGFGTYMKAPLFWVSWSILVIETVVLSTLQPAFSWLEEEVLHPPPDDLKETSSNDTDKFKWQTAAATNVEGTGTTIIMELIMFYRVWTPFLKFAFVLALILLIRTPSFTGELCATGSTCYLRLKESLLAMIVLFFVVEFFPCTLAIAFSTTHIPTFVAFKLKNIDIWVSILCDACLLIRSTIPPSLASRKTQIISDSISLTEVLAWEFRLMQGRSNPKGTKTMMKTIVSAIWSQEFYRVISFFSSSFSAVLTLTVALLVGGSFGSFMTQKTYWLCWAFVSTEALAESMVYITFSVASGKRGLVRATWVVRFVVHAVLFALMVAVLAKKEYYAADIRPECDKICQERGVGLLQVSCALSGILCLSFVTSWYAWYMLTVMHAAAWVYSLVYRKLMALVGLPWAIFCDYVFPGFCRGVLRGMLWVKDLLLCRTRQVSTSEEKI